MTGFLRVRYFGRIKETVEAVEFDITFRHADEVALDGGGVNEANGIYFPTSRDQSDRQVKNFEQGFKRRNTEHKRFIITIRMTTSIHLSPMQQ